MSLLGLRYRWYYQPNKGIQKPEKMKGDGGFILGASWGWDWDWDWDTHGRCNWIGGVSLILRKGHEIAAIYLGGIRMWIEFKL